MYYWLIPLVAGIISLAIFLFFRAREKRLIAVYIKGATSLLFIITALVAWLTSNNPHSSFGLFVVLGLVAGSFGDVFLDIKFISLKRDLLFTILGFCSFGIGHIFYISGLFLNFYDFNSHILYLIIPIIASLVFITATLLMEKFTKVRYGKMKPFVIVYGLLLFFTTTMYMSTTIQSGWQIVTVAIMAVSLISFAISDLILNNTYFAPGFNTPPYIISNHIFYYAAQFAIATSLFFLLQ